MEILRKYNAPTTIQFSLRDYFTGELYDTVLVSGDTQISKDRGAFVNTTDVVANKVQTGLYELDLTTAEMSAANIRIRIQDQDSPKLFTDFELYIETYGHASAQTIADLGDIIHVIESQRGEHSAHGNVYYVSPNDGATHASGARGGINDPYNSVQQCHDNAITTYNHDLIILLADDAAAVTEMTSNATITLTKSYFFIRGPGRDFLWTRTGSGDTISITGDGVELSGFQLETAATGTGHGIQTTDADFSLIRNLWVNATRGDGINVLRGSNLHIHDNVFTDTGAGGAGAAIDIKGTGGSANNVRICDNHFRNVQGDSISISGGSTIDTLIQGNIMEGSTGWAVNIGASSTDAFIIDNRFGNNDSGPINDNGTTTVAINNEQWESAGAPQAQHMDIYVRDRAVAATINFSLTDNATKGLYDVALATGDVTISKDEGAFVIPGDDPPSKDQTSLFSLDLTLTEMTASRITIKVVDQTVPKAFADAMIYINTDTQASGGYSCTVTIRTTGAVPIEGATVWPSLNTNGTPAYATSKVTNSSGEATFWLPDGTYYFFATGAGYSYPNAGSESLTVSGASISATFDIGTLVSGSVGGTSADTFLTRTVADVRQATDEPSINKKYTDANIIRFIEEAYTGILGEMQRNENTHIVAEYTITYASDQEYYLLPGAAGSIISVGYKDPTYGTKFFYAKGGHLSEWGTKVTIENNFLRIQPRLLSNGEIITVAYLPSGCAKLFSASTTTYTAGSITFDSGSLDEGSRDVRPYAYVGSTLRILPDSNNVVQQERIITGQSGTDYNVFEVSPDFDPVLSSTAVFEIYPSLPIELDAAVTLKVAMRMLMAEGDQRRFRMMQLLYSDALRTLQLAAANKDYTHGALSRRDGFQRRRRRSGTSLNNGGFVL